MSVIRNPDIVGRIYRAPQTPHIDHWTIESVLAATRLPNVETLAQALSEMHLRVEIKRASKFTSIRSGRLIWLRGYVDFEGPRARRKANGGSAAGHRSRLVRMLNIAVGVAVLPPGVLPKDVPMIAAAMRKAQALSAVLLDPVAFVAELNRPIAS